MSRWSEHRGLFAILAAFLLLGGLYLRVTPFLETPDEPSHFSVIKYIADEGRLPPAQPVPADAGPVPVIQPGPPVYYAPPLYYLLGALLVLDLDTDGFAQAVIPNPNWARGWAPTPGRSSNNKHVYVHTADQRPPLAGWAVAMVRLRIFSLLLGGATVSGVYALSRTLWSRSSNSGGPCVDQRWVLVTTALVAFNPAFLFVTIGVTNDALLIALSTWIFVLMAWLVSGGHTNRDGLVMRLGVLLGLAVLTKQSALLFLPVAVLAVVWQARLSPRSESTLWKWLLLVVVPVVMLAGWWYLYNALRYADPLGFQPHQTPTGEWTPSLALLMRQLVQALQGYWGVFGWGLILVEPAIYVLVAAFVLIGLAGWVWRPLADEGRQDVRSVVVILGLGVLLNLVGLVLWLWRTSAPYGRLLYPTLGPLAALLVMGWNRWLGLGSRRLFAWVVVLLLGLYAAVVPWRYLRPAFANPVVPAAALRDADPLDVTFIVDDDNAGSAAEVLRLLGYRMTPANARPGDLVTLTLYWQAITRVPIPFTVFVQVAPLDPEKWVAGLDDYLGSSRYPSDVWQLGETIRQVHRLRLADDAPAPAVYWFAVGLYGASDSNRLLAFADGTQLPSEAVRLGPLRVLNRDSKQPSQPLDYRLGTAIRLTGYDLDFTSTITPESVHWDSLTVTLYWQALAAPNQDLAVFVHLLDADGRLVSQDDSPPRQGDYPTWAWQKGDQVPDVHTLLLPSGYETSTDHLLVGLYRPEDDVRLPVYDQADQRVPNDAVLLRDLHLSGEKAWDGS